MSGYETEGDKPITANDPASLSGMDEETKRLMRMHETYLQAVDELSEKMAALAAEIEKTNMRKQEFIRATERLSRAIAAITGEDESKGPLQGRTFESLVERQFDGNCK